MLRAKLFVVAAVGLSAAACSYNSTITIPSAPGPVYVGTGAGQACVEYGFPPGSVGYNRRV